MPTVPTVADLITIFVAVHMIAADRPPTPADVGWMMREGNGAMTWEAGRLLGLVKPGERPQASLRPFDPPNDHRRDLSTLRDRAKPKAVPGLMKVAD